MKPPSLRASYDGILENVVTHQYSNSLICRSLEHLNKIKEIPSYEEFNIANIITPYHQTARNHYYRKTSDLTSEY